MAELTRLVLVKDYAALNLADVRVLLLEAGRKLDPLKDYTEHTWPWELKYRGFGDQREVELLVEAGFTPLEAIHIASANGAEFLGEAKDIGTVAPGKAADLILIHGDPSKNIADIEKVETVFKDGVGYDSAKLIESIRGSMGLH